LYPTPPPGTDGNPYLAVGGGYRLLRRLGRGYFGEVWHAEAPGGVEVAVKIITRSLQAEETKKELKILEQIRRLRHHFLLGLQAFFQLQDRLVIVLELADRSLTARLEECRRAGSSGIPPAELLAYLREAAEALDFLHEHQLQHRDIKPDNLLVLGRHVKVADLGLARLLEKGLLETASHAGTPLYTAPEVWNGKLSVHSDQYSLAVSYALLRLGRPPFRCEHLAQLMYAHLLGTPDLEGVGEAEERVLLKALAKKAEERHPSCTAFAEALAAALQEDRPDRFVNSVGMEFVLIPAGKFRMGSTKEELVEILRAHRDDEPEWYVAEVPPHEVEITRPFYLGKHEVTVGQFRRFVEEAGYKTEAETDGQGGWGFNKVENKFESRKPIYSWRNAGFEQTDEHPVVNVTWNDAVAFCDWLSKKEGKKYRLPTEAEWEYSCRANTTTRFWSGDADENLRGVANIADASFKQKYAAASWAVAWDDGYPFTAPVGRFKPNGFGLCDMHGNVWEWCQDWYGEKYYQNSPPKDPQGPSAGSFRVIRGGSFYDAPRYCRSAFRDRSGPADRVSYVGIRVVCVR
jgi:formylglycine-generating enzyme